MRVGDDSVVATYSCRGVWRLNSHSIREKSRKEVNGSEARKVMSRWRRRNDIATNRIRSNGIDQLGKRTRRNNLSPDSPEEAQGGEWVLVGGTQLQPQE